jgi:hypothetical protein
LVSRRGDVGSSSKLNSRERRRARRGGGGRTREARMTIGARSAKPAARSGSTTRSRLGGALAVVVLALMEPAR